jgi:hypothetical protein
MDEEQMKEFGIQNSQMSRQSSLRSFASQPSFVLLDSQESQGSQKSKRARESLPQSLASQQSAVGIPREFDYLFRSSQDDEHVLALDPNYAVSLSIGVVCVAYRQGSDNNPEIKPHTLQKTFYSYPKNSHQNIKKAIQERIDNDIADFKLQGYTVTTYTFGLPFAVEETSNISRGYDGKTKMLKAARKKK